MKTTAAQYGVLATLAILAHIPLHAQGQDETSRTARIEAHQRRMVKALEERKYRTDSPVQAQVHAGETSGPVSIVASNLPLHRIVSQLQTQSGTKIRLRGEASDRKVTLVSPIPRSLDEVLDELIDANPGLVLKQNEDGYEIWAEKDYAEESRQAVVYKLDEARAGDVGRLLLPVVRPGSIDTDERLNKLIITAVPETHAEVSRVIKELDQKLETRTFALKHADPEVIALQLEKFLSLPRNTLSADERTRQLMFRGTATDIRRAEEFVQAFDIPAPADVATSPSQQRLR